jgi:CheY-like chemotaxis protein
VVKSVASGEKAVEFIRREKADLMVLDMIMDPGIDGLSTYEQILLSIPASGRLWLVVLRNPKWSSKRRGPVL